MNREEALKLLKQHIKNEKMIYHSLSSEAVMRGLAEHLGEDKDKWALAGLLHDIDSEITEGDPKKHALIGAEMLTKAGLDEDIIDAVKMHNEEATGMERSTKFQHALAAGETITGLIYATALIYPDKKIKDVKPKSISKRMKQKAFAASVNRDTIMECEKIDIPLNKFIEISLNSMKEIANDIGL